VEAPAGGITQQNTRKKNKHQKTGLNLYVSTENKYRILSDNSMLIWLFNSSQFLIKKGCDLFFGRSPLITILQRESKTLQALKFSMQIFLPGPNLDLFFIENVTNQNVRMSLRQGYPLKNCI